MVTRIACCCGPKEDGESISINPTGKDSGRYPNGTVVSELSELSKSQQAFTMMRVPCSRQPGKPCTSRTPVVGDMVVSMGGRRTGHSAAGVPKAWVLMPWQLAQVIDVDSDGDFRLKNEMGAESGFMFRKEFAYVAETEAKRAMSPSSARSDGSLRRDELFEVRFGGAEKIGLLLDHAGSAAFEILAVEGGAALAHNQKATPSEKICFGDFIVGVNGTSGVRDTMVSELEQRPLTVTIAPRIKFSVVLEGTKDIGVECSFQAGLSATLLVEKVNWTGLVPDYNGTVQGPLKIAAGDRITEVNGLRSQPQEMLDILNSGAGKLELVIGRPLAMPA